MIGREGCGVVCYKGGAHVERCHGGNKTSYECAESHVDGITGSLKGGKQMSDVDNKRCDSKFSAS